MSRSVTIADTGPIVAFLSRSDRHHAWARERFANLEPPLLTCEAVLSEACFLAGRLSGGSKLVLDLLERRVLSIGLRIDADVAIIARTMERFADVPMSLADACLVRMSELSNESVILTLDSDFRVYRRHGRQVIPTMMPSAG